MVSGEKVIFTFLVLWSVASLLLFVHHSGRLSVYKHDRHIPGVDPFINPTNRSTNTESKYQATYKSDMQQIIDKPKIIKTKKPKSTLKTSYKHDTQYLQYQKCSTTIRHQLTNSSKVKRKYVADITILLSHGDITKPEFHRLRQYRDTMGWKQQKYEDITNALSFLNTSTNRYLFDDRLVNGTVPTDSCVRCAVVGNGGILNGSRQGRVIDAHNYVFRTNVALTKGFEADVGSKTTFYCFAMNTLSNSIYYMKDFGFREPPWNPEIRYVFMPENDWAYRYIYAALTNSTIPKGSKERYAKREPFLFPKPLKSEELKVIHPDFFRYIENSWLSSPKLTKSGRATTGAIMLFLALHTCDEVNAFGFMGDPKKYSSHYYDEVFKRTTLKDDAWHDWDAENKLWQLLIDAGVLNMYTRI